ncbi:MULTISPECIES: Rieske (2Fe-2S) protein [Actinoplanes]|uniref:Rieske (2Fe-2S) protein n=1 Tax=Actinoplanes TaxID=1865 RepID=UPI000696B1D3|nr:MULTISPECIES: Rieske (2Fe-2S) protein [Actinoplanes]
MTDVQIRPEVEAKQENAAGTCCSSRRAVLLGAGAAGATAVLAACGTSTDSNPNGTDFANDPAPAGSAAAPGGADSTSGTGSSGGTALVAAADVSVGSGVILDNYVVTQPTKGTFKAFSKVCTHQGCDVTEIEDGEIICKCHNAHYSIKDGSPTSGPAKSPLEATKVKLDGDQVVTA